MDYIKQKKTFCVVNSKYYFVNYIIKQHKVQVVIALKLRWQQLMERVIKTRKPFPLVFILFMISGDNLTLSYRVSVSLGHSCVNKLSRVLRGGYGPGMIYIIHCYYRVDVNTVRKRILQVERPIHNEAPSDLLITI
jgi:hypothetical protein